MALLSHWLQAFLGHSLRFLLTSSQQSQISMVSLLFQSKASLFSRPQRFPWRLQCNHR